jgi:hypothetical protein
MAKHICIRIYPNDDFEVTDENGKKVPPVERDMNVKTGKKIGQAVWWNENPTCVIIGGVRY